MGRAPKPTSPGEGRESLCYEKDVVEYKLPPIGDLSLPGAYAKVGYGPLPPS